MLGSVLSGSLSRHQGEGGGGSGRGKASLRNSGSETEQVGDAE